jgi:hypothetical protein
MREYVIYLITREVAQSYYGKENKLYQLFMEEQRANSIHKKILEKQIHYITSLMSVSQIEEHLWNQFRESYSWRYEGHSYSLECKNSSVRLEIHERHIRLHSFGNLEAETVVFEALRRFQPFFLAMDFNRRKFGWLTPFKLDRVYAT